MIIDSESIKKVDNFDSDVKYHNVIDKDGMVTIPEGYRWCEECNALTPHDAEEQFDDSDYICKICYSNHIHSLECPNCGWSPDKYLEEPAIQYVKAHKKDCQKYIEYLKSVNEWEIISDKLYKSKIYPSISTLFDKLDGLFPKEPVCDCPEEFINTAPFLFNWWERSSYNTECYNAIEWGCDIRCQICGCIFEYEDTNC
jgi:hypothetical protein